MSKLVIKGGSKLNGELDVYSAKNAVLPLLAATVMADGTSKIKNCPMITDVFAMQEILTDLGCDVKIQGKDISVDPQNIKRYEISEERARKMRSSIFLLGALLSKYKKAVIAYPGGCDIGLRPINLHIDGLKRLGVKIKEEDGYLFCDGTDMKGDEVTLDFPSVGTTENLIMAATLIKGRTVIKNAATEPEIADLASFINKMGGKIRGGGTGKVIIDGVDKLTPCEYLPIPDRIVVGTYLIAGAMCGGEITLNNVNDGHISSIISKLKESACKIYINNAKITLKSNGEPKAVKNVITSPYPGFPTDLQAQMIALSCVSKGLSIVEENMFETRFRHVSELIKMGADITIRGKTAIINGVKSLSGTTLRCFDLRGGAATVLAALKAEGRSTVYDVHHIDRGYESIERELNTLGADITRI